MRADSRFGHPITDDAGCALSDAGPREGDGEMGLAGAGAADEHDVALALEEAAAGELLDQGLVDRRGGEVEVGQLLGRRQPGGRHLVLDGARRLVGDLDLQQRTDDLLHRMAALEPVDAVTIERVGFGTLAGRCRRLVEQVSIGERGGGRTGAGAAASRTASALHRRRRQGALEGDPADLWAGGSPPALPGAQGAQHHGPAGREPPCRRQEGLAAGLAAGRRGQGRTALAQPRPPSGA